MDAEILDCAAGLFARHGFERTSIQQVAAALKYSKAGLLHHYPSKKALFDAVVDRYEADSIAHLARVLAIPPGIERDRALVLRAIEYTFESPGMSALGQQLGREGVTEDPRFVKLGFQIIGALGVDLASPDMERMMRAVSALTGANAAARLAQTMNLERECRSHIFTAAMATLGHDVSGLAEEPAGEIPRRVSSIGGRRRAAK